ncbi:hypothetical protein pipiens_016044, partial [Culex pipiens pipiens]
AYHNPKLHLLVVTSLQEDNQHWTPHLLQTSSTPYRLQRRRKDCPKGPYNKDSHKAGCLVHCHRVRHKDRVGYHRQSSCRVRRLKDCRKGIHRVCRKISFNSGHKYCHRVHRCKDYRKVGRLMHYHRVRLKDNYRVGHKDKISHNSGHNKDHQWVDHRLGRVYHHKVGRLKDSRRGGRH